ncbi:MAG: ATP synthase subunit I [Lachnospiraceae bacterium]|nr:ATP synthase subunit I [Lachnospiraceae bacterium]
MRKARKILNEMMIGLVVWLIPVLIILLIIAHNKIAMALGVLWGGVWAAVLLLHMYRHLDIALDMDPKHAQGHVQFAAIKRMFIMAVVIVVSMTAYRYIHPVGTVFGIYGMKISAYLQPMVHKFIVAYKAR